METPKLTPIEYDLTINRLSTLIKNVTKYNSGLADLLVKEFNKIDLHVQALESEIQIMEGINNGKGTQRLTEQCDSISTG